MGKLHQIRRAFGKLDYDTKTGMHTDKCPLQYGCIKKDIWGKLGIRVPDNPWCFYRGMPSYRNYVTKLVNKYHHDHIVSQRHKVERAYLDGEEWAIKVITDSFEQG